MKSLVTPEVIPPGWPNQIPAYCPIVDEVKRIRK
jgi:hypothetical protein